MAKSYLLIIILYFVESLHAQSPNLLSYQAVIRNTENELVANSPIGIQISILQGNALTVAYSETHIVASNKNGLVSLTIGSHATNNSFSNIDWSKGPYFIQMDIDPLGGTDYTITSTNQLLSVPYALYAENCARDEEIHQMQEQLNKLYNQASKQSNFSIVILPDTQHYLAYGVELFSDQISWIIENKEKENIVFVCHSGDMINNYSQDTLEWHAFRKEISRLWDENNDANKIIPFAVTAGNHDYVLGTRNSDMMNKFMPLSIFKSMYTFGGAFEENKSDNTYHTFRAGGKPWLILMLEFGPRNAVIEWANDVVSAHPHHTVMVITHGYLNEEDLILDDVTYHSPTLGFGLGEDANNGEDLWNKLIRKHENIRFVFCGHTGNSIDGVGYLESIGAHGNTVYQMMANFQRFNYHLNYFRILNINTLEGTMNVKTYSPDLDNFIENDMLGEYQLLIENIDY